MKITEILKIYHKLIIALIGLILISIFNPFLLEKRSVNRLYEVQFTAKVKNKYLDSKERKERIIEVINIKSKKEFVFFTLNENEDIYNLVDKGDTIIKIPNSFDIIISNGIKNIKINIQESRGTEFF